MTRSVIFIVLVLSVVAPRASAQAKKLIEFGWDEPDTAFMRAHIAEMEQMPFDGTVFHVTYTNSSSAGARGSGSFMSECWSSRAFTEAELKPALDDLKNTPFKRFTHNFLRFNVCPGNVDWFDDAGFTAIVNNARLAARIAREGKAKGILFDIEQYNFQLFNYRKQRDAATKSWDEYAAQVRKRGREVMAGFQEGYPDVTILPYARPVAPQYNAKRDLDNPFGPWLVLKRPVTAGDHALAVLHP